MVSEDGVNIFCFFFVWIIWHLFNWCLLVGLCWSCHVCHFLNFGWFKGSCYEDGVGKLEFKK